MITTTEIRLAVLQLVYRHGLELEQLKSQAQNLVDWVENAGNPEVAPDLHPPETGVQIHERIDPAPAPLLDKLPNVTQNHRKRS